MDAQQLRDLQAPLKARYREDPSAARLLSVASGTLLHDRASVRVATAAGSFDAGLHPLGGGDGLEKCSADLLMEALVSCAGVTFNAVATAMGVPFTAVKVIAEGVADVRGTLGVAKDAPVGMTDIRLRFEVDSTASDEQIQTLLRQTERYCVIYQTLRNPPPMLASVVRVTA